MDNEVEIQSSVPLEELVDELRAHVKYLEEDNERLKAEVQNRDTQIGEYKGIVARNEFLRPHADRLVGLMGFESMEQLISETESRSIASRFQYRFIQLLCLPLMSIRTFIKRRNQKKQS